jgi:hypothetical protein
MSLAFQGGLKTKANLADILSKQFHFDFVY